MVPYSHINKAINQKEVIFQKKKKKDASILRDLKNI